jgi:hypothetical protein
LGVPVLEQLPHALEVGSRAKGLVARARDDEHAGVLVLAERNDRVGELHRQLIVHIVVDGRAVEGQKRDARAMLDQ